MATRKFHAKVIQEARASHTGRDGDLFFDDSSNQFFISDGSTAGGVPLSLKEMNKIISSLSLIINGVLADKNKSDAYLYNKFYYFFGFRKWKI